MTKSNRYMTLEQRLAHNTPPPDSNGCRIWTGATNGRGYAVVGDYGRNRRVARLVLEKKLGRPLRTGLMACHECDNSLCVSEDCLYEGTHQQNMDDKRRRDRAVKGENCHNAVLTEDAVRDIRSSSDLLRILAAKYSVSVAAISLVRRGINWKHVPSEVF